MFQLWKVLINVIAIIRYSNALEMNLFQAQITCYGQVTFVHLGKLIFHFDKQIQ